MRERRDIGHAVPPVLFAALLLASPLGTAWGALYRHVDDRGVVHLTDRPLGPGYELVIPDARNAKAGARRSLRPWSDHI